MKNKLIYLDNAATSHFKPKCVIKKLLQTIKNSANPGRSSHELSLKNAIEIFKTRETVAKYFNLSEPENVVFTKNCTEALNTAILGLLNEKDFIPHVICSCFEHNSVLRPLKTLESKNKISLSIVCPENKEFITKNDINKSIKSNTYLVCITHISNVTGNKNDIENIGKLCKERNILFLVDCAQSVGHLRIDMQKNNINYLTFAGHKGFLSPQGIGGLCINSKIIPSPIIYGGTGTESEKLLQPSSLPESLESGTLMTPNICALKSGIKYVEKHFDKNIKKIEKLTRYLIDKLKIYENERKIKIYTSSNSIYGVVSIKLYNHDSIEVVEYLNEKFNIALRGGLHCAPLTHNFLGTTNCGLIRISLNFKNTKKELDKLLKALKTLF